MGTDKTTEVTEVNPDEQTTAELEEDAVVAAEAIEADDEAEDEE